MALVDNCRSAASVLRPFTYSRNLCFGLMVQFHRILSGLLVRFQAKSFVISDIPDPNRIDLAGSLLVVGKSLRFVHAGAEDDRAKQSAFPILTGAIDAPARVGSCSHFWIVLRPGNEGPVAGICALFKSGLINPGRSDFPKTARLLFVFAADLRLH